MVKSDFLQFSASDFILDESFQGWVFKSDKLPSIEWNDWMNQFPERSEVIVKAKSFVTAVVQELDELVDIEEAEQGWIDIESRLITAQ